MPTTRQEIQRWFEHGIKKNASVMLVVCDTFDHDDYPVYIMFGQDARRTADLYDGKNMQRLMEVYNLRLDMQPQLQAHRSWNWPPETTHER